MAQSPAHRFGQIIGDTLEATLRPVLEDVAQELGLYLDGKGARQVRGAKRKVAWVDGKGNSHDLDYVFEAGGSDSQMGVPRAFIEIAWRRYTKHSRNKAQEIQGAILPLAERYAEQRPFLGVVLGGVFTAGSLNQLRSHGFSVLYFPYDSVIDAFRAAGIDAAFDESTSDASLLKKVRAYERLTAGKRDGIAKTLRRVHQANVQAFVDELRRALNRKVTAVYVTPLYGSARTLANVAAAVDFIRSCSQTESRLAFVRYEVGIRYSNGDEVRGQFQDKATAVAFLQSVA